jgi:acetyltransferase-like isoleucine patch superfamily enzyme
MSNWQQAVKTGRPQDIVEHAWKRLWKNGPLDLLLGLWIRHSFTKAGIVKVCFGLPLPKIMNKGGRIEISDCRFYPGVRIECAKDALVRIGKGSYLNRNVEITAFGSVVIGADCMIARDVLIMDTDQHPIGSGGLKIKPVEIEDRVWIGSRAMILKGVTLGHDSVIAAGAIVTKSVPPYSVVASPAARVIKSLV